MRPVPAALAAVVFLFFALSFFLDPLFSLAATALAGQPVQLGGVRLRGIGDFSAASARLGPEDRPRVRVRGVRVRGAAGFFFGGALRVRFWRAESEMGFARGGLFWRSGRLAKAHARVTLSPKGLSRVPAAWLKRLLRRPDGRSFYAFYRDGRVVLRGKGGPILQAAWQPG